MVEEEEIEEEATAEEPEPFRPFRPGEEEEIKRLGFIADIPETVISTHSTKKAAEKYISDTKLQRISVNLPPFEFRRVVPGGKTRPEWWVVDTAPPIRLVAPELPTREELGRTMEEVRARAKDWKFETVREMNRSMDDTVALARRVAEEKGEKVKRLKLPAWVKGTIEETKAEAQKYMPVTNIGPGACVATHKDYSSMFASARFIMDTAGKIDIFSDKEYVERLVEMRAALEYLWSTGTGYSTDIIVESGQIGAVRNAIRKQGRWKSVQRKMSRVMHQITEAYLVDMTECLFNIDLTHATSTQRHELRRECGEQFTEAELLETKKRKKMKEAS